MLVNKAYIILCLILSQLATHIHSVGIKISKLSERRLLNKHFVTVGWLQTVDGSEDGIKYAHDEITYRVRSGEILHIPQADRYSSRDWWHNLKTWPYSELLRRIKGVLAFNLLWSIIVFIAHTFLKFKCPGARAHSFLGSALGLLLVFRTNTAYERFWEGRKIWESVLNNLRDLGRFIILYSNLLTQVKIERIFHLMCAFPLVLQEHVQGFHHPVEVMEMLSSNDIERMNRVTNRPYFITNLLATEIKEIPYSSEFTSRERLVGIKFIENLSKCIGSCERIVQTPVPLTYARHTSRFLSLFCFTAPVALVAELGHFIIPFAAMTSWALFGILEIGMIIEEPFQKALKLEVFANTIRRDLSDLLYTQDFNNQTIAIKSSILGYKEPFFSRSDILEKAKSIASNRLKISATHSNIFNLSTVYL